MSIFRVNVDKVFSTVNSAGTRSFHQPGSIVEIESPDKTAKQWIEKGWLTPVIDEVASEPNEDELLELEEDEENVNDR